MRHTSIRSAAVWTSLMCTAGFITACSSTGVTNVATEAPSAAVKTVVPSESSATRVDAVLTDNSITLNPSSATPGEVRFYAKNTGTGVHELVVVKSDADPAALPVYGPSDTPAEGHAVGDVDEDKVSSMGEIEDIEPGATKDATFQLAPGKYVLMCNLAGHYALGMHTAFTVK